MAGWLVTCLVGWLAGWFVGCFNHQVGGRKSSKLAFKSIKLEAKIVYNWSQEASWRGLGGAKRPLGGVLGGSWAQEGPKSEKMTKK